MQTPVSTRAILRRTLSSFAAIAVISVIFGAKALEAERIANASALQVAAGATKGGGGGAR